MDVVRLDASYWPDSMVEGYTSMIWTERHQTCGEFELKTPKVEQTRTLLPEGTAISLLDSHEAMFVESHTIGQDSDGHPELTLTGRTLETFLENRIIMPTIYGEKWQVYRQYTPSEMISLLIWMHLQNQTGEDPTRAATTMDQRVAISQFVTTDSTTMTQTAISWSLEAGVVYDIILDFLTLSNLGLRTSRPINGYGNLMSFDTSRTVSRGTPTKTYSGSLNGSVYVDVYNGLDRTRNQSDRDAVIFHYDSGHIDDAAYLFSIKEFKNEAAINSSLGTTFVLADLDPPIVPPLSGINRRSMYIDGGTKGSMSDSDFLAAITQKAKIELKKHNRAALFDGTISPLSPYKYNTHYALGDKVTLLAEYGYEAQMIVSEYVRTEDLEGDRGYPGLILAT